MKAQLKRTAHMQMSEEDREKRRSSIGGSDAKILMSGDQKAIEGLWKFKRGEAESDDLSDILLVQLGNVTEALNTDWFEFQTGYVVTDEQKKIFHPDAPYIHSTLDGLVRETTESDPLGLLEAKFMMPFGFSIEAAIEKYTPQVQHNMLVNNLQRSWLSIISGAGQWYLAELEADFFYQAALFEAEKDFWDCVKTGRTPGCPEVQIPLVDRIRVVDMSESNEWKSLAFDLLSTKGSVDKHEKAKKAIKKLMPADAGQAKAHGVGLKLSKDGKILMDFDKAKIIEAEAEAVMRIRADLDEKEAA